MLWIEQLVKKHVPLRIEQRLKGIGILGFVGLAGLEILGLVGLAGFGDHILLLLWIDK